jgi:cytoskeletal protein CcmA (bactofilin family)
MSMFGKSKSDDDFRGAAPQQQYHRPTVTPQISPNSPAGETCIGSDVTIVGKLVGQGIVTIFGRIEGELRASEVTIGEGAEIQGNIVAQELTVGGYVKGTIHAERVKLIGTAKVEGDIFHRSLSIDENAMFEGSSRREEDTARKHAEIQPAAATPKAFAQTMSIDSHEEV